MPDWQPILSDHLQAAAYDAEKNTLRVKFTSGHEYSYANVTPSKYSQFINSPQPGQFFRDSIKGHHGHTLHSSPKGRAK